MAHVIIYSVHRQELICVFPYNFYEVIIGLFTSASFAAEYFDNLAQGNWKIKISGKRVTSVGGKWSQRGWKGLKWWRGTAIEQKVVSFIRNFS